MRRRQFVHVAGVAAAVLAVDRDFARAGGTQEPGTPVFTLRNPGCPCCEGWVDHMRSSGFEVHMYDSPALDSVKRRLGVPDDLVSCHTSIIEGYRVEGHVPANFVRKLLDETPAILGIAVPAMPTGSPGMEGPNPVAYDVIAFNGTAEGDRYVFGSVNPGSADPAADHTGHAA